VRWECEAPDLAMNIAFLAGRTTYLDLRRGGI
jgi:hypothetical protein